jgi:hypothetical protein
MIPGIHLTIFNTTKTTDNQYINIPYAGIWQGMKKKFLLSPRIVGMQRARHPFSGSVLQFSLAGRKGQKRRRLY